MRWVEKYTLDSTSLLVPHVYACEWESVWESSSSRGCSFFNKKCILGTLCNLCPHWIFFFCLTQTLFVTHMLPLLRVWGEGRREMFWDSLRCLLPSESLSFPLMSFWSLLEWKGWLDIIKCKTSIQTTIGPWRLYFFTGIICNLNWDLIRECCARARSEWG